MKRFFISALGVTAIAGALVGLSGPMNAAVADDEDNAVAILREPVLIYDQSGFTLTGAVHTNLVVYNDGFAAFSRADDSVFPPPGVQVIDARTTNVGIDAAEALREALGKAGASNLDDSILIVNDAPLSTITYFRKPGSGARANTFSFFGGAEFADVNEVVFDFINTNFPSE